MSEFKLQVKIVLFLSSYCPLWLMISINFLWGKPERIALLSGYYLTTTHLGLLFLFFAVVLFIALILLMKLQKRSESHEILKVDRYRRQNRLLSSYLIVYIFAFLPSIFGEVGIVSFLIFFITLMILQVKSELLHINPMLALLGYNIYEADATIEGENQEVLKTCLIITRSKDLREDLEVPESENNEIEKELTLVSIGEGTFIIVDKENQENG